MQWNLAMQTGSTLTDTDGNVYSLNPSSNNPPYGPYHFSKRPAGTNGVYEQAAISGNCVTYNPTGQQAVVYGWQPVAPNTNGFGAISQEPLA